MLGRIATSTFFAAAMLASAAATAAEPISYGVSTGAEMLPVHDVALVDWDGFYAGIYAGGRTTVSEATNAADTDLGIGLALGAIQTFDFFLAGAEVAVRTDFDGAGIEGQVLGRGGILVTEDLLAYGAVGYGAELGAPGTDHLLLGGGVEVAVTEGLSLRGQYLYGQGLSDTGSQHQVTFGANFHF